MGPGCLFFFSGDGKRSRREKKLLPVAKMNEMPRHFSLLTFFIAICSTNWLEKDAKSSNKVLHSTFVSEVHLRIFSLCCKLGNGCCSKFRGQCPPFPSWAVLAISANYGATTASDEILDQTTRKRRAISTSFYRVKAMLSPPKY